MANRAANLLLLAEERAKKTALIFDDEHITFEQLANRVRTSAAELAELGVRKGSRVGIMMPSSPEFIVIQQALFMLGAVVSPLNIFYKPGEIAHVIQSCDLEHVVLPADLADRAPRRRAEELPSLRSIIMTGAPDGPLDDPFVALRPIRDAFVQMADVADDDVAMLLNTSATTGKSKGVMLTAANLAANYDRTPGWLGLNENDVILCALPLYNTFGLNQCINAMLVTGATMVLLPRFEAKRCIDAIAKYRCTFLPAVPTMLQKIVDHEGLCRGALSSVDTIMTGGAPVPAALLRRVLEVMGEGTEVLTGYGLTEGTALVTLTAVKLGSDGDLDHGRTIGRVLDGMELAIRAEDGQFLPANEMGEIVVRGPNLMLGYYKAPGDTAVALADGWLHSGDLGYIDEDGYAFIVDRKKDVIIRGGQNIYPADIEEVLYQQLGVAEAAVVGMEDDVLGEVPIAFVALQGCSDISSADLLEHCKAQLAHYKVPAAVIIMPELPKGPTGKILRRELRPLARAVA